MSSADGYHEKQYNFYAQLGYLQASCKRDSRADSEVITFSPRCAGTKGGLTHSLASWCYTQHSFICLFSLCYSCITPYS